MVHTHSNHQPARSGSALGCLISVITLLSLVMAALLPTLGARAQAGEPTQTQTPTTAAQATATAEVLTETPQEAPSPAPEATQELPTLTPTSQFSTSTASQDASPSPSPSATAPVDTQTPTSVETQASPACPNGEKNATIKLDGITISICAPILPGEFIVPDPSSSDQIATAATLNPYHEFSITAIPYGMRVSTETLPPAGAGLAAEYLQELKEARTAQDGHVEDGLAVSIFGTQARSIASLVKIRIHGSTSSKVAIVEWVADAGERLWIIRYSQEILDDDRPAVAIIGDMIQFMADVAISSPDIATPSTSAKYFAAPNPPPQGGKLAAQSAGDLPFPSWWSGDCDKNNYPGSYPLGGIYLGVKACGPISTSRVVQFFPKAWGELEWQCVELSMRFLYLAYHILPYSANGNQVVENYQPHDTDDVTLVKISNGTKYIFPQAGDVLSYGPTSLYGHTSVVTGSNVDGSGNGTITIIEQNVSNPSNGMETLKVTSWTVTSWMVISGWLHGKNPLPSLSSITPTNILQGSTGLVLTVFGKNFTSGSTVRWNGASLPTAFVSSTELIAAVPNSNITSSGTASVTVHNPGPGGGNSSAKTFTINNTIPVLTNLSPTTVLIGSSSFTMTVNGSNYQKTSKVLWNNVALTTTYVSSTKLTASVPSSKLVKAGVFNIVVSTPNPGGGMSAALTLTVKYRVPTVASISPTSALTNANDVTLTVNGTYFAPTAIVRLNGADLATTYTSSTKLTAVIPAANMTLAASLPISVFNPGPGGGLSASSTGLNFKINNPLPALTSISPGQVTAGASTFSLTVNGKNFVTTSQVRWNGSALSTTFVNPTQLTAQVTAQLAANPGWMNITVNNPTPAGGTSGTLVFKVVSQTPGVCAAAKNISIGASDTNNNGGPGSTNNIDTYKITTADVHGPEFTYLFKTAEGATVAVNIWDTSVTLKVFLIDGGSGSCNAANVLSYGSKVVFKALANHDYYFVVDGYAGAAGSYRIVVDSFTPMDGTQLQTARPIFHWPAVPGAKTYTLQASTSTSFSTLLVNKSTSSTTYATDTALPSNKQIYWRVKTNTGSYIYMPNQRLGFKTGNPPSLPKLSYPSSNGLLTSYTPLLDWSTSSLPSGVSLSHYEVQVALDSTFKKVVITGVPTASAFQVDPPGLTPNTKYYWRVQAIGSNGSTSNWTIGGYFRAAMLPTSLVAPPNTTNPALTTLRPTFSWNPLTNITSYTIQISTGSSFITTKINTKVTGTSYTPASNLTASKTFYWRVRAEGANGPSLWSPTFSFKTP
jgi:hypothetical protein